MKQNTSFNASEYAENLSHELLTPLAVIRSKAELLLQSKNLTEEELQHLDVILKTVQRMSRLNKALITLSKIEHQVFKDVEEVDLYDLLADTVEKFEDHIRLSKLGVRFPKPTADIRLKSNRNLLEILLSNLIKNAVIHNVAGGELKILLSSEELIIENTANPNLIPEDREKRFVSNSSMHSGSGLGLSIVNRICEQLKLQCSSFVKDEKYTVKLRF